MQIICTDYSLTVQCQKTLKYAHSARERARGREKGKEEKKRVREGRGRERERKRYSWKKEIKTVSEMDGERKTSIHHVKLITPLS